MFLSNSNNHVQLQPFLGFYWLQDHMPQCLYFVFMNHGIDGIETMWSQTQQFEQPVQVRSSPETQGGPCWRQQDRSRVSKALCPALLADQVGLPPITPSVYTRIEFLIFL